MSKAEGRALLKNLMDNHVKTILKLGNVFFGVGLARKLVDSCMLGCHEALHYSHVKGKKSSATYFSI